MYRTQPHSRESSARESMPAVRRREPYTVERYPGLGDTVVLVGYDGRGELYVETRMPANRFTPQTMERMRRWIMKHDANDAPSPTPLSLVE